MSKEIDAKRILTKFLKLPKEKQALIIGFVEGVQYDEKEEYWWESLKPKEPDKTETAV